MHVSHLDLNLVIPDQGRVVVDSEVPLADKADAAGQDALIGAHDLDLWVPHVELALDEEGGLLPHRHLLQPVAAEVDLGCVHDAALEWRPGHVLAVELELDHVRLGLLGHEGDGVRVVALGLGAGRHLAIVH